MRARTYENRHRLRPCLNRRLAIQAQNKSLKATPTEEKIPLKKIFTSVGFPFPWEHVLPLEELHFLARKGPLVA